MINIKTEKEIEIMKKSGQILAETLWEVLKNVKPGVSEIEIDTLAEKLIKEKGGEPGFKLVEGYDYTICVSVNDVCVHGIPTERKFKDGDVVGIDCGVFYKGFHTDMSHTIVLGNTSEKINKFLKVGQEALEKGIKQAVIGNRIGDISEAIQKTVEKDNGYSIVRTLVGHGVGKDLHEEPEVPGFLQGKIENSPKLTDGMVIAIEVIYNMGGPDLVLDDDGWTLKTKDKSLSGLYERTVAITKNGSVILTP